MKRHIPLESLKFATRCVHGGVYKDPLYNSVVTPLYPSSTFYFEGPRQTSGYDYTRTKNPTRDALEENLASLEGGAGATAVATGMAAITTALHLLPPGAHVIAGNDIYGGTYRLFANVLPARGLRFSLVDMGDLNAVAAAFEPDTALVWIETPSNPLLRLTDIAAVSALAREHGALICADNTFLSPYLQRPLALGADLVVHSTTKYLNGHSDVVGGAIVAGTPELAEKVAATANALGTTSSPYDAWLVLRGVKTLPLRMQAHERNAQALAQFLLEHPKVSRVHYPGLPDHPGHALARRQQDGFGAMLSFDLEGGEAAVFRLVERLKLYAFAESLGGVESLIEHPASMSHAAMTPQAQAQAGIGPGLVRVSVGIEDADDLIADLAAGLANA
ncbi:trans-sulfuration enzyme family protein [Immundisolibacter sp.]|uniref:trans-sulfuration enzyme family protein n=1 Tax=Immundisolibacter sp. TaxID=1934948 RepID=UPI000EDD9572|nr:cystathionine gamma-synthase [Gammaproteobacteria bacterium]